MTSFTVRLMQNKMCTDLKWSNGSILNAEILKRFNAQRGWLTVESQLCCLLVQHVSFWFIQLQKFEVRLTVCPNNERECFKGASAPLKTMLFAVCHTHITMSRTLFGNPKGTFHVFWKVVTPRYSTTVVMSEQRLLFLVTTAWFYSVWACFWVHVSSAASVSACP